MSDTTRVTVDMSNVPDLCPGHLCPLWCEAFGDCSTWCSSSIAYDKHFDGVRAEIKQLSAEPFTEPTGEQVDRAYRTDNLRRHLRIYGEPANRT